MNYIQEKAIKAADETRRKVCLGMEPGEAVIECLREAGVDKKPRTPAEGRIAEREIASNYAALVAMTAVIEHLSLALAREAYLAVQEFDVTPLEAATETLAAIGVDEDAIPTVEALSRLEAGRLQTTEDFKRFIVAAANHI
jgi:hypothetical protein